MRYKYEHSLSGYYLFTGGFEVGDCCTFYYPANPGGPRPYPHFVLRVAVTLPEPPSWSAVVCQSAMLEDPGRNRPDESELLRTGTTTMIPVYRLIPCRPDGSFIPEVQQVFDDNELIRLAHNYL